MSATATTVPRRSARHAPVRWVSHFEKQGPYDKQYVVNKIKGFIEELERPYEEGRYYTTGVKNELTMKCHISYFIFTFLIYYPRILIESPKFYNETIKTAKSHLNTAAIVNSDEVWARQLVDACNEFIEMCSYIHMLK